MRIWKDELGHYSERKGIPAAFRPHFPTLWEAAQHQEWEKDQLERITGKRDMANLIAMSEDQEEE